MPDKSTRTPIIDPVLLALKSRRVIVALCALGVGLLVMAIPELAVVRNELLTLVIALALAVIGGYSLEDAAAVGRDRAVLPPDELRTLVKEVVGSVIDELADPS